MSEKSTKINVPTKQWMTKEPIITQINTLYAGTRAMRSAGQEYLPQFKVESGEDYERRIKSSFLNNETKSVIETCNGRLYKKPPVVEVDKSLDEFILDVDQQGSHINTFAHNVTNNALRDGFVCIYTDYTQKELGESPTMKDLKGTRPYWSMVKRLDLIGWKTEVINGTSRFTEVRIRELGDIVDPENPFEDKTVPQVRRVWLEGTKVYWEIWQIIKGKFINNQNGELKGIDFIPLDVVYADQQGFCLSDPPYEDLSWKNIEHWQSSSDQNNILRVARVPILAMYGEQGSGDKEISVYTFFAFPDSSSKMEYVEHSGKAIEAGWVHLTKVEETMSNLGINVLKNNVQKTAKQSGIEENAQTSKLGLMSMLLSDGITNALHTAALWLSNTAKKADNKYILNSKVGVTVIDDVAVKTLIELRKLGDISLDDFLNELQRQGALSDDLNIEESIIKLAEEGESEFENEPAPPIIQTKQGDDEDVKENNKEE